MKNKYSIDSEGFLIAFGQGDFDHDCGEIEIFKTQNPFNYRFDFVTNTWIYDPIIMIPQEITKLQCVEQLRIDNKYDDLIIALKIDDTGWDMIRWEAAAVLARDSQMVTNFAIALSMTSEDVDTFFINASNIYL